VISGRLLAGAAATRVQAVAEINGALWLVEITGGWRRLAARAEVDARLLGGVDLLYLRRISGDQAGFGGAGDDLDVHVVLTSKE
jgi:hypothetical protein